MPISGRTSNCPCEGRNGAFYTELGEAERQQLIIIDRYTVGDRQLALIPCSCPDGQRRVADWRALPAEAAGVTLKTIARLKEQSEARRQVAAFVQDPRGWLVLSGHYGTGKTKLVYAALNELAARGRHGRYILLPDLLDELRDGIKAGVYADRLKRVVYAPILAIDELDKFREDSAWATEVLQKLFITRYRDARFTGTILVYNRERADRLPEFLQSRVTDGHFLRVELVGVDLRPIADKLDPWDRGEGEGYGT